MKAIKKAARYIATFLGLLIVFAAAFGYVAVMLDANTAMRFFGGLALAAWGIKLTDMLFEGERE